MWIVIDSFVCVPLTFVKALNPGVTIFGNGCSKELRLSEVIKWGPNLI